MQGVGNVEKNSGRTQWSAHRKYRKERKKQKDLEQKNTDPTSDRGIKKKEGAQTVKKHKRLEDGT